MRRPGKLWALLTFNLADAALLVGRTAASDLPHCNRIFIMLQEMPSQIDFCDSAPAVKTETREHFATIKNAMSGISLGDLLPRRP